MIIPGSVTVKEERIGSIEVIKETQVSEKDTALERRKQNELKQTVVRFELILMRCMDQELEQRIIRAILR